VWRGFFFAKVNRRLPNLPDKVGKILPVIDRIPGNLSSRAADTLSGKFDVRGEWPQAFGAFVPDRLMSAFCH
jgi:hypothetical protein